MRLLAAAKATTTLSCLEWGGWPPPLKPDARPGHDNAKGLTLFPPDFLSPFGHVITFFPLGGYSPLHGSVHGSRHLFSRT